jgi:hypothetical protein
VHFELYAIKVPAAGCSRYAGIPEFGSVNLKTEPTGTSVAVAITLLLPPGDGVELANSSSDGPAVPDELEQAAIPAIAIPAAPAVRTWRRPI